MVATGGAVTGVRGDVLEPSSVERGQASSRTAVGEFALERPGGHRHLRAASAETTTSCAATGRSVSARRRST